MERLTKIEETLITTIEEQLTNLECVDSHELGEVIDIIKDIEQAKYYHSLVENKL